MDRLDLYKELYFKELERKNTITDSLSLPIGIITGLIAWLFYFFNERYLPYISRMSWWTQFIFYASLISLILSIFFLVSSFFKPRFQKKRNFITSAYNYGYIPYPNEYESYYQKQLSKNGEPTAMGSPISNKALEDALIDDLSECTAHNIKLNEQKTGRVSNAKFYLALCLFINFTLLVSMITNSTPKEEKIEKIKIIDTVKVSIHNIDSLQSKRIDTSNSQTKKNKKNGQ